jgi:hypothetical protein
LQPHAVILTQILYILFLTCGLRVFHAAAGMALSAALTAAWSKPAAAFAAAAAALVV